MPKRRRPDPARDNENEPRIVGATIEAPDEDDALRRAIVEWEHAEKIARKRLASSIEFRRGPVALTFAADLHIGNAGTNYNRIFSEARTVIETPGMYLALVGDLIDNYILPKLVHARSNTHLTITDEWVLLKKYLTLVAPKLVASVRGNHEKWTNILGGLDYFGDALAAVKRSVIYDTDDALIELRVGAAKFPMRLRHVWRGSSIYNITHGIERASAFDGYPFAIGVGAHTHTSGVIRSFNCRGAEGYAVLCGTYKRFDEYAREKGFSRPNESTAQTLIFFEDGTVLPCGNVARAAETMRRYANRAR